MDTFFYKLYILFSLSLACSSIEDLNFKKFDTQVESSGRFACGAADICTGNLQYCDTRYRYPTCQWCSDYHSDCFREAQQKNCTPYCLDQYKQFVLLKDLNNVTDPTSSSSSDNTDCIVIISALGSIVGILLVILSVILIFIHRKQSQTNAKKIEDDVTDEETLLEDNTLRDTTDRGFPVSQSTANETSNNINSSDNINVRQNNKVQSHVATSSLDSPRGIGAERNVNSDQIHGVVDVSLDIDIARTSPASPPEHVNIHPQINETVETGNQTARKQPASIPFKGEATFSKVHIPCGITKRHSEEIKLETAEPLHLDSMVSEE